MGLKFVPTNLNFKIRFRVNEQGLRILKAEELGHIIKNSEAELPMWEFMKIFGPTLETGYDNQPFNVNVDIQVLDFVAKG